MHNWRMFGLVWPVGDLVIPSVGVWSCGAVIVLERKQARRGRRTRLGDAMLKDTGDTSAELFVCLRREHIFK